MEMGSSRTSYQFGSIQQTRSARLKPMLLTRRLSDVANTAGSARNITVRRIGFRRYAAIVVRNELTFCGKIDSGGRFMPILISTPDGRVSTAKSGRRPQWTVYLLGILSVVAVVIGFVKYEDYVETDRRSPWDVPVEQSSFPYRCEQATSLPENSALGTKLTVEVAQVQSNIRSVSAVKGVLKGVEDAADVYKKTGSRAASACVLRTLDAEAALSVSRVASNSEERQLQQLSIGAFAISYLKVRHSSSFSDDPAAKQRIVSWLRTAIMPTRLYYEMNHPSDANEVWAALDLLTVSVVSNDGELFETASNLLNTALWHLAPRVDSRPITDSDALKCPVVLPIVAPAALALEIESAGEFPRSVALSRLHEVAIKCVDHQEVTPSKLQGGASGRRARENRASQLEWLERYLPALSAPSLSPITYGNFNVETFLGGQLPGMA